MQVLPLPFAIEDSCGHSLYAFFLNGEDLTTELFLRLISVHLLATSGKDGEAPFGSRAFYHCLQSKGSASGCCCRQRILASGVGEEIIKHLQENLEN